ncbi:anthrone oxygenase family protein [Humibacter ginsengisoli]
MQDILTTTAFVAATVSTGLLAGVFQLYAFVVMPGLRRVDDRTFVTAFAALDRAIVNPWFLLVIFFGAPVLCALAAVAAWGEAGGAWATGALAGTVASVVITVAVHLPVNNALKAAAAAPGADAASVRRRFGEVRWAAWNLVRAVLSTASAVGLGIGLAQ